MLKPSYYIEPSEVDQIVFEKLIPADHQLRQIKEQIDFESFREITKDLYSASMGRPAEDPVRMIKLEFLEFLHNLSDREVLKQLQVNVAFRYFLDLSLDSQLPSSGLLSQFRTRLGVQRHQALFEDVVRQARAKGLVKDRLRLKDATHVIANIAIPSAIGLIAQTREKLLRSAKPYAKEKVEEEERQVEQIRVISDDVSDNARLLMRLEHLREIVTWTDELQKEMGHVFDEPSPQRERFDEALRLAHQILEQADKPDKPDRILSAHDPDARKGKHVGYFEGYHLDISMDADSELITSLSTPAANQDEAANAIKLIDQEEKVQGNDIQALSMDGIGFRGDVLRALQDPQGPTLAVYVPPRTFTNEASGYFMAQDFHLKEDGQVLVCPNEEESRVRSRNRHNTGWLFSFKRSVCQKCPLLEKCIPALPDKHGRHVSLNDYETEYQSARDVAKTEAYRLARLDHPKVERKLAEMIRYHAGRRTRFRGMARVAIQYLMTAMVVNVKRMVRLLLSPTQAGVCSAPGEA